MVTALLGIWVKRRKRLSKATMEMGVIVYVMHQCLVPRRLEGDHNALADSRVRNEHSRILAPFEKIRIRRPTLTVKNTIWLRQQGYTCCMRPCKPVACPCEGQGDDAKFPNTCRVAQKASEIRLGCTGSSRVYELAWRNAHRRRVLP